MPSSAAPVHDISSLASCLGTKGEKVGFRTSTPSASGAAQNLAPASANQAEVGAVSVMLLSPGVIGALSATAPDTSVVALYGSDGQAAAAAKSINVGAGAGVPAVAQGNTVVLVFSGLPQKAVAGCTS